MEEKIAYSEPLANSRALVKFLNDNNIPKEDIVTVLDGKGQLLLIYYK
jgi:hypothetical protein